MQNRKTSLKNGDESESTLHFNSYIFEFVDETLKKKLVQFCHWLGFVKIIIFFSQKCLKSQKPCTSFLFSLHYKCQEKWSLSKKQTNCSICKIKTSRKLKRVLHRSSVRKHTHTQNKTFCFYWYIIFKQVRQIQSTI